MRYPTSFMLGPVVQTRTKYGTTHTLPLHVPYLVMFFYPFLLSEHALLGIPSAFSPHTRKVPVQYVVDVHVVVYTFPFWQFPLALLRWRRRWCQMRAQRRLAVEAPL